MQEPAFSPRRCFWRVARSVRISSIPQRPTAPATPRSRWRRAPRRPTHRPARSQRFAAGPRHSAGMVGALQIAGAQRPDRALAEQQSVAAIGDRHAARGQPGGLRAGGSSSFPLVQANFNPTRQLTSGPITPVLNSAANPFNLYTAQVAGVVYLRRLGPQSPRRSKSLKALADNQRFQVEAAYLTLTSNVAVAADHRGLAARPDRGHQRADCRSTPKCSISCNGSSMRAMPTATT